MSLAELIVGAVRLAPARLADSFLSRVLIPRQQSALLSSAFADASLLLAPDMRMTLSASDFMHGWIAFAGVYERELSDKMLGLGKAGGVLVDVGANWGYFSLLWAAANPSNRVLAIEASPRNAEPLKRNIDRNGLASRVTPLFVAAGAESGEMPFDVGPEGIHGWGGFSKDPSGTSIKVPVQPLDELCTDHSRIDVLKIDVEGAEAIVLQGAERLLREQRIKRIFLELNETRMKLLGIDRNEPQRILERHGYRCSVWGDELEAEPGAQ